MLDGAVTASVGQWTTIKLEFLHKDHLGSISVITDANGGFVEAMRFEPFGKRVDVLDMTKLPRSLSETEWAALAQQHTNHGFTGHEHLDAFGLIHMGGRLYDPHLGRFLNMDLVVQAPENGQNLNRYSYVLNNPLSYTDPSGFSFFKIFRSIAAIAINIYLPGSAFLVGLLGAFSAAGFSGIGKAFQGKLSGNFLGSKFSQLGFSLKTAAHGITGGILPVLQGGKFGSGFASAGTGAGSLSFAREAGSFGLDLLPVAGSLKSLAQLFSGRDLVTGAEVSRTVEAAGILLGLIPGGKLLLKLKKGARLAKRLAKGTRGSTEIVQRAMSRAELDFLREKGVLRFGRSDRTFVSDAVNSNANRARQRLGLPKQPEVRVTIEVPAGRFSSPTRVEPFDLGNGRLLPGGGLERSTTGVVPARIIRVDEFR